MSDELMESKDRRKRASLTKKDGQNVELSSQKKRGRNILGANTISKDICKRGAFVWRKSWANGSR